jgi:hypothetical protein
MVSCDLHGQELRCRLSGDEPHHDADPSPHGRRVNRVRNVTLVHKTQLFTTGTSQAKSDSRNRRSALAADIR